MAQRVKVLSTKPNILSWIRRTHIVKEENQLLQVVSFPPLPPPPHCTPDVEYSRMNARGWERSRGSSRKETHRPQQDRTSPHTPSLPVSCLSLQAGEETSEQLRGASSGHCRATKSFQKVPNALQRSSRSQASLHSSFLLAVTCRNTFSTSCWDTARGEILTTPGLGMKRYRLRI